MKNQNLRVRDRRAPRRFYLDNLLIRGGWAKEIGIMSLSVYSTLAMHADADDQDAWPSQQTVADLLGVCRQSVNKAIGILQEWKLIEVEYREGTSSVCYLLHPDEWTPVKKSDIPLSKKATQTKPMSNKETSEDSSESSPAPEKRTRKRSDLDILKSELVTHFTEKSGLPRPPTVTKGERSAAGKLWWQPLIRIADCVDRDVARAQCLVEWALCHADAQELTVSSPRSIEKIAVGEQGRRVRQNGRPRSPAGGNKSAMTQNMEFFQRMVQEGEASTSGDY